jgi:hypothetical protein
MKKRFLVRGLQYTSGANPAGSGRRLSLPDHMAPFGTFFVIVGLIAVLLGQDESANYLVAAGLLLHLTGWFEKWWKQTGSR